MKKLLILFILFIFIVGCGQTLNPNGKIPPGKGKPKPIPTTTIPVVPPPPPPPTTVPSGPDYATIGQWYLDAVGARKCHALGIKGQGVKVAHILDSIDTDHPDIKIYKSINITTGGPMVEDGWADHATMCVGTLAALYNGFGTTGVAPECQLYICQISVLTESGGLNPNYESDFTACIQWCIDNGVQVITTSTIMADTAVYRQGFKKAYDAGIFITASAGNDPTQIVYPATDPSVVACSAIDTNYTVPSWSSIGDKIEFGAPGSTIGTTLRGGGWGMGAGTSLSSPIVAGVAALILCSGKVTTAQQLRALMQQTATDIGPVGRDPYTGYGCPNAYRAIFGVN